MGVKTHPWLADEPMAIKAIPEPQQDWGQWPGLCPWAGHEDIHDTSPAEGALARSWWQQGHTAQAEGCSPSHLCSPKQCWAPAW